MAFHWHISDQQVKTSGMFVPSLPAAVLTLTAAATAIPNLYCLQTLSSVKAADSLNRSLESSGRPDALLNVLLQVNTSGEDEKSGLPPLNSQEEVQESGLVELALHVIQQCPRLRLQGLMTIGSLAESISDAEINKDFVSLVRTRDVLEECLRGRLSESEGDRVGGNWGEDGKLILSMGMSSDFEAAIQAGSDIVRVGTGIFGRRHLKGEK